MQLFYSPEISNNDKQYTFNKEESKHIVKVLMNLLALPLVVRKTNNTLGYQP